MSEESPNARRRGKFAQLPRHIRETINRMLDDGRTGREVLEWANAQPEVIAMVAEKFGGEPLSDNNLSQWFKGGFLDWRREQEQVEKTAALAELSMRIAKESGGSIAEGAVAIAGGKVLAALESADGEGLLDLITGVANLRGKEIDAAKLELAKHRSRQRDEVIALEKEKFQRLVVGKFIDLAENQKAMEIAKSDDSRDVKMDQLMELMFGKRPQPAPAP